MASHYPYYRIKRRASRMNFLFQISQDAQVMALTEPPEIQTLIHVLEDIARQLGWQPGHQLHTCLPNAQHLAVLVRGEIAGGLQFMATSHAGGFAFRHVWPEAEVSDPASTIHITIMALREEYRGRFGLFWPLCVELWRYCGAQGIRFIVLEATPPTLRLYRRLGWPLEIMGELRMHWGEECYLCRMDVQDVAEALAAKAEKSNTYRILVEQAHQVRRHDRFGLPTK